MLDSINSCSSCRIQVVKCFRFFFFSSTLRDCIHFNYSYEEKLHMHLKPIGAHISLPMCEPHPNGSDISCCLTFGKGSKILFNSTRCWFVFHLHAYSFFFKDTAGTSCSSSAFPIVILSISQIFFGKFPETKIYILYGIIYKVNILLLHLHD